MSLAISDVYISGFKQVFAFKKKRVMLKLVIFTNYEISRYRGSSFTLNELQ